MSIETGAYVPEIELPGIKEERLGIKNYALLGVFTTSLERARVGENPRERDFFEAMKSDDEPNLVDGQVIAQSENLLLHLDVPPREVANPREFMTDLSRSIDMIAGYCQAFPELRYVYGTSYLSKYAERYGFETEDLPPDSLKARVGLEMYREAKGEEKAQNAPTPKLAYITPESLLERSKSIRSTEDENKRSLGMLTITHQRLSNRDKNLEQTTSQEMKNYCVGNTLKIELNNGDKESLMHSLDMLVGYIKAFPSIQDVYVVNPGKFRSILEEIGFGDLNSEECPVFYGRKLMLENGGEIGASKFELLDFSVRSSDTIKRIDSRKIVA